MQVAKFCFKHGGGWAFPWRNLGELICSSSAFHEGSCGHKKEPQAIYALGVWKFCSRRTCLNSEANVTHYEFLTKLWECPNTDQSVQQYEHPVPARAFGKEDKGVISTIGNVPPPSFSPRFS